MNALDVLKEWAQREYLIRCCLDGGMGSVVCLPEDGESECAAALFGDFAFFAGNANSMYARSLIRRSVAGRAYRILTPADDEWGEKLCAVLGSAVKKETRYALKKEAGFDRESLKAYASLAPEGARLVPIGRDEYAKILRMPWARDLCSNYRSWELFSAKAYGVAAVMDGEIVSGASCYGSFPGGIEIEIDTREDMRRKHLAIACGAGLILMSLDRGDFPSWDAANIASLEMAKKLGYRPDGEYPVWEYEREKPDRELAPFVDGSGRFTTMPSRLKKQKMMLWELAQAFDRDREYSEKEVNALINGMTVFRDHATLRRDMVDSGLMERDRACRVYKAREIAEDAEAFAERFI